MEITVTEDGGNVVFLGSGSLDIGSPLASNSGYDIWFSDKSFGAYWNPYSYRTYRNAEMSFTSPVLSGRFEIDDRNSRGIFKVDGRDLYLRNTYLSGEELEINWLVRNATIDSLNLSFGEFYRDGANSVSLIDGRVSPVPLPAGASMLIAGLGALGLMARRRRRTI